MTWSDIATAWLFSKYLENKANQFQQQQPEIIINISHEGAENDEETKLNDIPVCKDYDKLCSFDDNVRFTFMFMETMVALIIYVLLKYVVLSWISSAILCYVWMLVRKKKFERTNFDFSSAEPIWWTLFTVVIYSIVILTDKS